MVSTTVVDSTKMVSPTTIDPIHSTLAYSHIHNCPPRNIVVIHIEKSDKYGTILCIQNKLMQ